MDTDDMYDSLDYIRNGSADTLALAVETTPSRMNMYSFSSPLYKVQTRFIMRQTENVNFENTLV